MASVNQYPPPASPPPVPPYRYRRSITGPVILIGIGVLFLLSNLGFIQRWQLWHWFGHWWPILLILWGVIALVEHSSASRMGYRTRHLGAGGIVLLILLVGLGVTAHYSSDVDWSGVRDQIQMDDGKAAFDEFDLGESKATPFQAAIHSLHFYPWMLVIEKHEHPPTGFPPFVRGTELPEGFAAPGEAWRS